MCDYIDRVVGAVVLIPGHLTYWPVTRAINLRVFEAMYKYIRLANPLFKSAFKRSWTLDWHWKLASYNPNFFTAKFKSVRLKQFFLWIV